MSNRYISFLDRFHSAYMPEPNSGCWLWLKAAIDTGYGVIRWNNKLWLAHRASWMLHRGEIPSDMYVCHKCDTPSCVNPDHLFLGTPRANFADMQQKGRYAPPRGERQGQSKLTETQVVAIRNSGELQDSIAAQYGISQPTVSEIRSRKKWAWL
jgi:hypothetical protein